MALPVGNSGDLESVDVEPKEKDADRFQCPDETCESTFGTKKALRAHLKKFHRDEEQVAGSTRGIEYRKGRVDVPSASTPTWWRCCG